jgi:O-antigen ligase
VPAPLWGYFVFLIICFLSVFFASSLTQASAMSFRLALIFANLILLYNILTIFDSDRYLINAIIFAIMFNFLVFMEVINVNYPTYLHGRFTGTVGNPNLLSIGAVFSLFCSIFYLQSIKLKLWHVICNNINILICIYLIIVSASKKGILAGVVILIVHFMLQARSFTGLAKLAIFSLVIIVSIYQNIELFNLAFQEVLLRFSGMLSAFSGGGDVSTIDRISLLSVAVDVWLVNPFLGMGIDNFKLVAGVYAHSTPFELLANVGIFGVLAYYSMYGYLFLRIYRLKRGQVRLTLLAGLAALFLIDMTAVLYYAKIHLIMITLIIYLAKKQTILN